MRTLLLLFLIQATSCDLTSQNLIVNGSFEEWEKGKPTNVEILSGSPDFYKRRHRVHPAPLWDDSIKTHFAKRGSDGISYAGINASIAGMEAFVMKLQDSLEANNQYKISLYAKRLEIGSYKPFDKVAYILTPQNPNLSFENNPDLEIVIPDKFKRRFNYVDTLRRESDKGIWMKLKDNYVATGGEKFLLVHTPVPNHIDDVYYVLYDDISITKERAQLFTVFFESNSYSIDTDDLAALSLWLEEFNETEIEHIIISGYADKKGNSSSNKILSQNRIAAVKTMIDSSFPEVHVLALAYGEDVSQEAGDDSKYRKAHIEIILRESITEMNTIDSLEIQQLSAAYTLDQRQRNPAYEDLYTDVDMHRHDSTNQILLTRLFDQYGYLGVSLLSEEMMDHMGILVLHQDVDFQVKILPLIEEAADNGECSPYIFAYLIDKIKVAKKEPQFFGSQMYFSEEEQVFKPYPISRPEEVDIRRKEYGLNKLKDYIDSFNSEK